MTDEQGRLPDSWLAPGHQEEANRRILGGSSVATTSWTYEDQKAAMEAGFNSVVEWAVWNLLKTQNEILARLDKLEGSGAEVEAYEP